VVFEGGGISDGRGSEFANGSSSCSPDRGPSWGRPAPLAPKELDPPPPPLGTGRERRPGEEVEEGGAEVVDEEDERLKRWGGA
jgi:hypothetical protein